MSYLPAYTDRHDLWTIDGDTKGGALRLWPVYVLGGHFSGPVPRLCRVAPRRQQRRTCAPALPAPGRSLGAGGGPSRPRRPSNRATQRCCVFDCSFGIQLDRKLGTADHVHPEAGGDERIGEGAVGNLAGTNHERVEGDALPLSLGGQVQPCLVDSVVGHITMRLRMVTAPIRIGCARCAK